MIGHVALPTIRGWRHQMETFSALLAICAGNSPVPGEIPAQRPVTRSFDVFFDLRLNKRLRKQTWGWWFETPSRPLWRHCNDMVRSWHWTVFHTTSSFMRGIHQYCRYWCFLCCQPEQAGEQKAEMPVIWDVNTITWHPCYDWDY